MTDDARPARDPRVDAYIDRAAAFAQPLLKHLRSVVHAAHPGISETIKWGFPHFMRSGRIVASMAAFKTHASFGFWQRELVGGTEHAGEGMGQFGRLTGLADLPSPAKLKALVKQAVALIDADSPARARRPATAPKPSLEVPPFLQEALARHPKALATFDAFPPSAQREYVEWLAEAKQAATRERRMAQALEWLAEGKRRNWKYEKC